MPSRAIAIPVEQITTYFHAASTAARVRRCPTRNAVTIVVASTATHNRPRLEASTASAMAERNTWTSTLCWVAVRVRARPALISPRRCAGVAAQATTATTATTSSMNALRASARSSPPAVVRGPEVLTCAASVITAASTTTALPVLSHAVRGPQPATR